MANVKLDKSASKEEVESTIKEALKKPAKVAPPVPLPANATEIEIEIWDRSAQQVASIKRVLMLPQRILLIKSLLDSLAGVKATGFLPAPVKTFSQQLQERVIDGAVWTCEYGRKHHCGEQDDMNQFSAADALENCQNEFYNGGRRTNIANAVWFAAHVPAYFYREGYGWRKTSVITADMFMGRQ